jgi:O-antigen ligase
MTKSLQNIFIFFSVFCYQLSQIFISNILFVIYFIVKLINNKKIKFNSEQLTRYVLFSFLFYIILNTLIYSIFKHPLDVRGVIQLLYNFQYLFLIVIIDFNFKLIEKHLFIFSVLLSHILIFHFIISGDTFELYKWNDLPNLYFPGWPNTFPLYLIFAMFINRNLKYHIYFSFSLLVAIFITGSRGALLGALCVLLVPLFRKFKNYLKYIFVFLLIILIISFNFLISLETDIKFLRSFDRIDIFYTSYAYIKQSFLFGYGGNTLDQLNYVNIDYDPLMEWGHTHNFVLEFLLRYGLVGLLLFTFFLYLKIKEIKDFDYKFLFSLFVVLSFFQTFMRDFIFLSILILISHHKNFNFIKKPLLNE